MLLEDNSLDLYVKEKVKELLNQQGYHTYVERLDNFKFYVTDFYKGTYCPVAFMAPNDGCICINPGFIVDIRECGPIFQQLSVIVRHELLHFLLCHEKRFKDYLKQTDPDFKTAYDKRPDLHTIANYAMDYDLGNVGYDDYDKEVVRNMTLNGKVISGLLAEEVKNRITIAGAGILGVESLISADFNNFENRSFEEMFQLIREKHEELLKAKGINPENPKNKPTIHISRATHSQEYRDIYNKVIQKYGLDKNKTVSELSDLLARAMSGENILGD